jgi:hypothetical protein
VTWDVGPEAEGERATRLHFSWRDAVTFSDATLVANTGRFVSSRPPGLVVIAIIAGCWCRPCRSEHRAPFAKLRTTR